MGHTLMLITIIFVLLSTFLSIVRIKLKKELQIKDDELKKLNYEKIISVDILAKLRETICQLEKKIQITINTEREAVTKNAVFENELCNFKKIEEQAYAANKENKILEKKLAIAEEQLRKNSANDAFLEESKKAMKLQFENLANAIFQDKAEKFQISSKNSIQNMLSPFRLQIEDFKKQVEYSYSEENKERRSLQNEVHNLKQFNEKVMQEAVNLTNALKVNNKTQGNWGELVLERILSESGLQKGHEFHTQASLENSEGKKRLPDVIVHLPNKKDIIIDSKVSLVDYERYHKAENNEEKKIALAAHIKSLKNHINNLHSKDYSSLKNIRTLDYVLMFIPIEPAFYVAIEEYPQLYQDALDKNIMLVTPTNLLVVMKTIHHIWKYEKQNANALEIAKKAGLIYDKLESLVSDMSDIGIKINKLHDSHDKAMKKFNTGRGNLIKQVHSFVDLGVKVKKQLPADIVDQAQSEIYDKNHE